MSQHFFRIDLDQALRYRNGFVILTLLLQGADEPVHGIELSRIYCEATAQSIGCSGCIALSEPVQGLVVEVFGFLRERWHA